EVVLTFDDGPWPGNTPAVLKVLSDECLKATFFEIGDDGFLAFNESYVARLRQWGLLNGDANPVARSNVCPEINPPAEPSFYAFSFTMNRLNRAQLSLLRAAAKSRKAYQETMRIGQ